MEYPPLLTESISDVFAEVSNTGRMTALDREMLQAALLNEFTTEEEKQAIDRLLYAVRLGRIQVIEHA
jgi:hypothetical protein